MQVGRYNFLMCRRHYCLTSLPAQVAMARLAPFRAAAVAAIFAD
jgi:hypothetical protein